MKFDVIIGNPPYQLSDGGGYNGFSASPLYHKFIQQAKRLNPRFISMIIPSRWFAGGRGLDDFRAEMLNDNRIKKLVDFPNSKDCFPNVEIGGGVCYFLWDKKHQGDCSVSTYLNGSLSKPLIRPLLEENMSTFIRDNKAISILHKIKSFKEESFSSLVSRRMPFGLTSTFKNYQSEYFQNSIKLYGNKFVGYINEELVIKNKQNIGKYKLFIGKAYMICDKFPHQIINYPILAEPNSCCTETYLSIGPFDDELIAKNVEQYMTTKFFRFFVLLMRLSQNMTSSTYTLVPMQDFSKPWTDEELYKKYNLTDDEISYIESMIKPMNLY